MLLRLEWGEMRCTNRVHLCPAAILRIFSLFSIKYSCWLIGNSTQNIGPWTINFGHYSQNSFIEILIRNRISNVFLNPCFFQNSRTDLKTLHKLFHFWSNFWSPSLVGVLVLRPKRKIILKISVNETNNHFEMGLAVSRQDIEFAIVTVENKWTYIGFYFQSSCEIHEWLT